MFQGTWDVLLCKMAFIQDKSHVKMGGVDTFERCIGKHVKYLFDHLTLKFLVFLKRALLQVEVEVFSIAKRSEGLTFFSQIA